MLSRPQARGNSAPWRRFPAFQPPCPVLKRPGAERSRPPLLISAASPHSGKQRHRNFHRWHLAQFELPTDLLCSLFRPIIGCHVLLNHADSREPSWWRPRHLALSQPKSLSLPPRQGLRLDGERRFDAAKLGLSFHHHLTHHPASLFLPPALLRPATLPSLGGRIFCPRTASRGGIATPPSAELWLAHPFQPARGNGDACCNQPVPILSDCISTLHVREVLCVRTGAAHQPQGLPSDRDHPSPGTRPAPVQDLSRIFPGSCPLECLSCFRLIAPPLSPLCCFPLAAPRMTSGY